MAAKSDLGGEVRTVRDPQEMDERPRLAEASKGKAARTPNKKPEWTQSLRQLYDSVVEEPLPDSFKSLLDQLDKRA